MIYEISLFIKLEKLKYVVVSGIYLISPTSTTFYYIWIYFGFYII